MGTDHRSLVLLTGASGYIGGRLLKALEAAHWPVRCLARRPEFLRSRVSSSTEVVQADCLDRTSLASALVGISTAYYLVHSMGSPGQFEEEDRQAARNFADAARDQGVQRIIYLGVENTEEVEINFSIIHNSDITPIIYLFDNISLRRYRVWRWVVSGCESGRNKAYGGSYYRLGLAGFSESREAP